jgi:glyceraldehyde 3-phosphate dehydrogenase
MALRIVINGFGRIGRLVLKALCEQRALGSEINVVAVVDVSADADYLAYLIEHDSVHGRFNFSVSTKRTLSSRLADVLIVDRHIIKCMSAKNKLSEFPWGELGVDVVIESSGQFTCSEKASGHLAAGAKKVIVTAPAQGDVKTIIMGVNEKEYSSRQHTIISSASCTAHCLAMLVEVLQKEGIGIETGFMTAINSYTASQRIVDGVSQKDWRSGRAAAVNIIPSVTCAANIVSEIKPSLMGKLTGIALRVPTVDVSMVEFVFRSERDTSIKELDALIKKASKSYLRKYLGYTQEELVSTDFIHNAHSAIYDSSATLRCNLGNEKRLFRLLTWYDNEWGYANRVVDLLKFLNVSN